MSAFLLAIAFLAAVGTLPVYGLTRSGPLTLVLAPLGAGLLCSLAGMVALLTRVPLAIALVPVVALAAGGSVYRLRRGRGPAPSGPKARHVVALIAIAAWGLVGVRLAPTAWDARSYYWFHAQWFVRGGSATAAAIHNPVLDFTHKDYPPFAAATVASAWLVSGRDDFKVAQTVTALLTFSGVIALAVGVFLCLARSAPRRRVAAVVVCGLLALAAYGFAGETATNGYHDLLWAAPVIAAAVFLLLHPPQPTSIVCGAICLAAAMLTKNEGLVVGLFVAFLVVVRLRRSSVVAWPAGLSVIGGLAWVGLAHALGAQSDVAQQSRWGALLTGDPVLVHRIRPVFTSVWDHNALVLATSLAVVAAGWLLVGWSRDHLAIGSTFWLVAIAAAAAVLVGITYVNSSFPLDFYLQSVDRTTIAVRLAVLTEACIWMLVAIDAVAERHFLRADIRGDADALRYARTQRPRS